MRIQFFIATALLTVTLPASAEKLMIGTSADFPPWASVDASGHIVGFDRNVGDEVCSRIGAECTWANQSFDGLLPALSVGKFDFVVSAMSINEKRKKQVNFTTAYADAPSSFIAMINSDISKASTKAELITALSGKKVGVQAGSTHEQVITAHMPNTQVLTYDSPEQIIADIQVGRIDAGLTDKSAWDEILSQKSGNIEVAGPLLTSADFAELGQGQGIVLAKNNDELKARINAAIQSMLKDGTLIKLSEDAFGYDLSAK